MSILVTGGAGYIGSIIVEQLLANDEEIVVFDNLVQGHREAISDGAIFIEGDIENTELLKHTIEEHEVEAVVHMAAETVVTRSMTDPRSFFHENVVKGVALLDAMLECDVDKIIFSSSAAVYGEPRETPITEEHPKQPINAYGESKLMFERILDWYNRAYGIKYASLRYFNAAGASERFGEAHDPESHLIPLVLRKALEKLGDASAGDTLNELKVFGNDYDTRDGTCIRDYIHVIDLAHAHILALDSLERYPSGTYNLGNGEGFTVLEVIEAAKRVTNVQIPYQMSPRRSGDPAVLVATAKRAREVLGWKPKYQDLDAIVESAWKWHRKHPYGYSS